MSNLTKWHTVIGGEINEMITERAEYITRFKSVLDYLSDTATKIVQNPPLDISVAEARTMIETEYTAAFANIMKQERESALARETRAVEVNSAPQTEVTQLEQGIERKPNQASFVGKLGRDPKSTNQSLVERTDNKQGNNSKIANKGNITFLHSI